MKRNAFGDVGLGALRRAILRCEARGHFEHAETQLMLRSLEPWYQSKQRQFGTVLASQSVRRMASLFNKMAGMTNSEEALAAAEAWIEERFDQAL